MPSLKSTKVPSGQSCLRISSRVTSCPGCSSNIARIRKGFSCRATLRPFRESTPAARLTENKPNDRLDCLVEEAPTKSPPERLAESLALSRHFGLLGKFRSRAKSKDGEEF